jgi:hypothetical protein
MYSASFTSRLYAYAVPARNLTQLTFLLSIVLTVLAASASAVVTIGTNTGAIPNGSGTSTCGAPLDVQFNVVGAVAPVNSLQVEFTAIHNYIGDLDVQLIAPNATAFTLFKFVGRTSATNRGFATNLNGTYRFADFGSSSLWVAAGASPGTGYDIPSGLFRTKAGGPFSPVNPGPPLTLLNTAFASVTEPNGTWTLRFLDCAAGGAQGDTGSVSAASLTIGNLSPTSAPATVSGRVHTQEGRGVGNVLVALSGGDLPAPIFAITNNFGYYSFPEVPSGQTYILSVDSKKNVFPDPIRVINLDEDLFGINFIAFER